MQSDLAGRRVQIGPWLDVAYQSARLVAGSKKPDECGVWAAGQDDVHQQGRRGAATGHRQGGFPSASWNEMVRSRLLCLRGALTAPSLARISQALRIGMDLGSS